jgi:soluble lytic murein transglycosylase-like protein
MLPFLIAAFLGRNEILVCAVVQEAERQGLDPVVVCALVEVESGYRIHARSGSGDYGLFQINSKWHGANFSNVDANISKGCSILRVEVYRCSGEIDKALSRYNTGRICRVGAKYARKVLALAARIKKACVRQKYHTSHYLLVTQKDRVYGFQFEWAKRREEA